jgi:hypothetical protein
VVACVPWGVFARGVVVAKTLLSPRTTVSVRPWSLDLVVSRRRAAPWDSVSFNICLLSRDKAGWVVSLRPSCQGQPFQYGLGIRWLHRGVLPLASWSSKPDSPGGAELRRRPPRELGSNTLRGHTHKPNSHLLDLLPTVDRSSDSSLGRGLTPDVAT